MNEEELKLLNKLDDLPNKLNLEIRGLILAEVMLRKENQELKKQQKEFIEYLEQEISSFEDYMKNIERSDRCQGDYPLTYYMAQYKLGEAKYVLSKYKEIIGGDNNE